MPTHRLPEAAGSREVLLVERAGKPLTGYWSIPGGLLEIGESLEDAKEAIRQSAAFSSFATDCRGLFQSRADPRHPSAWSDSAVEEKFEGSFAPGERRWILDEFARSFDIGDAVFHPSASIGFAVIDEETASADQVLVEADRAMYVDKQTKANG